MENQEEDVCQECLGTGEIDNPYFDEDSKEWYSDGTRKCLCQLKEE